jgi:hypothetical protein
VELETSGMGKKKNVMKGKVKTEKGKEITSRE